MNISSILSSFLSILLLFIELFSTLFGSGGETDQLWKLVIFVGAIVIDCIMVAIMTVYFKKKKKKEEKLKA